MAVSALFVLDLRGRLIISRDYRGDIPASVAVERFNAKLTEEDELNLKPIFEDDGINYIYVKHNNLYFLTVTRNNADACMALMFIYKLIQVLEEYFSSLEEESIRDNFVITYELLDEMIDFGYPQLSESKVLKEYITQQSHQLHKAEVRVPTAATGVVGWRPDGIKYKKNEVFLDVIEKVNLLVASNGTLIRSEIIGAVKIKSKLSGMPELRLGLNDRILFEQNRRRTNQKAIDLEDVAFHQCVKLSKFESDRTISFIPPDGEFELMSYRLSTSVKPLIWIEAVVDIHERSRVEYLIKARSQFKSRSTANNVEIIIPVPRDADSPKFRTNVGDVRYAPELDAIVWSIKHFPGGKEYLMRAHMGLPSISDDDGSAKKKPISVKYEIPYYTVSGIQVRYLKILEKSGYRALPWVRYITQNGEYQIRM